MMKIELIEQNVDQTLELRGLVKGGNESNVRLLLYHLYVSVCIWNLMSFTDKMRTLFWKKVLKDVYSLRCYLKKSNRRKAKEVLPPTPPTPEKENKEKEVENKKTIKENKEKSGDSDFAMRRKAFFEECQKYVPRFGKETVDDFYAHWSEENVKDKKMRWEYQKTWSTARRIYKWSRSAYTDERAIAAMKLANTMQRTKQQSATVVSLKRIAAEREADNARQEKERAESKAGAASMEETMKGNPSRLSTLSKLLSTKFENNKKNNSSNTKK